MGKPLWNSIISQDSEYFAKATRWDNYLHIFDPKIHWFSLINSFAIVVFLCIMVGMIVYRSVARDVSILFFM